MCTDNNFIQPFFKVCNLEAYDNLMVFKGVRHPFLHVSHHSVFFCQKKAHDLCFLS